MLLMTFNSIKVRLKRDGFAVFLGAGKNFQFHKGAIETGVHLHRQGGRGSFQFHKGAIETCRLRTPDDGTQLSIP